MSDLPDRIGELIGDPARRSDWRTFVAALHEATRPGGPLDGWLFHGTTSDVADVIGFEGVTTTESLAEEDGEWVWTEGTHWGTPKVAAFYAEDRIESTEDPDLELAIVAVRMSDLERCGPFSTDGQTIDCPLYSRLDRSQADTDAAWEASDNGWRACLDVLGTLLVLGPVGADEVRTLRNAEDVESLVSELSAGPRP